MAHHAGDLRANGPFPVFVKPDQQTKLFDGHILRVASDIDRLLESREDLPSDIEDERIMVQETVTFTSEWRVFVIHRVPQGSSHYGGDPLRFPSGP